MWFVNFFVDVGNVIISWIPLICYLGAAGLFTAALVYFSHHGHPGKAARGDTLKALLSLFVAASLASFPAYVNDWNVTVGLAARVHAGGALYTYQTTVPGFNAATPQQWVVGMIAIFMPFFQAWGAAAMLRALFLLRDAWNEGINVTWWFLGYTVGGVLLMNLDTLVPLIWPAVAGV
jgi:hypothetical protein